MSHVETDIVTRFMSNQHNSLEKIGNDIFRMNGYTENGLDL